jgi:hypothetical protein
MRTALISDFPAPEKLGILPSRNGAPNGGAALLKRPRTPEPRYVRRCDFALRARLHCFTFCHNHWKAFFIYVLF